MTGAWPDAPVTVEGGGLAALTAALLLAQSDMPCVLTGPPPAPGPVLLLHPGTLALLADVWGLMPMDLPALHRIRLRAVKPLPPEEPALIEQPSVAIEATALVETLAGRLFARYPALDLSHEGPARAGAAAAGRAGWRLQASGRGRAAAPGGGPLCAMAAVAPSRHWLPDRAIFEAVPGGWLFLLPVGPGRALLQGQQDRPAAGTAGGDLLEANLAASGVIPRLIEGLNGKVQTFAAAPHLAEPCAELSGSAGPARACADAYTAGGRIAIGDAAMALPPVTGDGVGNGIRTAIWAVAALRAIRRGDDPNPVLAFYRWRLRQAFNRMAAHTGTPPAPEPEPGYEPPYRLSGLDLVPNSPAD